MRPSLSPSTSDFIAVGWSPAGWYWVCKLNVVVILYFALSFTFLCFNLWVEGVYFNLFRKRKVFKAV